MARKKKRKATKTPILAKIQTKGGMVHVSAYDRRRPRRK